MDEFSAIRRFTKKQKLSRKDVVLGIGDDGAVVSTHAGHNLVLVSDVLVEGVHFFGNTDAHAIGYKALAVNLSDLAAMGAEPAWALVNLTLPRIDDDWLEDFTDGLLELAQQHRVQFIGGDTTKGPLTIGIQAGGWTPESKVLTRAGASANEDVYVSGTLGDAALAVAAIRGDVQLSEADLEIVSRRLHYPNPRVTLGLALRDVASAVIDVSDGLAADLEHLTNMSSVGCDLNLDRFPLSKTHRRYLSETDDWQFAISGGDDYELCFTAATDKQEKIMQISSDLEIALTRIGSISSEAGVRITNGGRQVDIATMGFKHF